MRAGHRKLTRMAGNPLPFMEYLDNRAADADIHLFPDQAEWHGIPGTVDFDMIVRGDAGPLPAGELVGMGRQRLQSRPVERGEQIRPQT